MWIPDLQLQSVAMAAAVIAAGTALPVDAASGYVVGRCVIARYSYPGEIMPITTADSYLFNYRSKDQRYENFEFDDGKVTLLKAPKHGKVTYDDSRLAVSESWYKYTPAEGYVGKDHFVMQVEKDGVKVKIRYVIEVLRDDEPNQGFCEPGIWKISLPTLPTSTSDIQSLLTFTGISGSARVGCNNQRALRRMKNLQILAPYQKIDAPGTRAAQKPPSVI